MGENQDRFSGADFTRLFSGLLSDRILLPRWKASRTGEPGPLVFQFVTLLSVFLPSPWLKVHRRPRWKASRNWLSGCYLSKKTNKLQITICPIRLTFHYICSDETTERWWSEGVELSSFERSVNYQKVGGTFGQNKTV
jgi:hypothetical protein